MKPGGILIIQTEVWKRTKNKLFKIDVVAVYSLLKKKKKVNEMKENKEKGGQIKQTRLTF